LKVTPSINRYDKVWSMQHWLAWRSSEPLSMKWFNIYMELYIYNFNAQLVTLRRGNFCITCSLCMLDLAVRLRKEEQ